MIHVEGMGVIGSLLAHALAERQIEFTWSDTYAPVNAWKASTGAVFPAGDQRSLDGLSWWADAWRCDRFDNCVELADYWYSTKHPPHGYKGEPIAFAQELRLHPRASVHVNVQELVMRTRQLFSDKRRNPEPFQLLSGRRVVVAHGFNQRLNRYVWGWTRPVTLSGLEVFQKHSIGRLRQAFYLRRGKYVMAYAYPIPGTDAWYAGSSLIVQPKPRSLEMLPKYERWKRLFEEMSGLVVKPVGDLVEGWRPSTGPVSQEEQQPLVQWVDGRLLVMPLWHSGVRWAPLVVDAVLKEVVGDGGGQSDVARGIQAEG